MFDHGNTGDFVDFMGLARKFPNGTQSYNNKKKVNWNRIRYLIVTREEQNTFCTEQINSNSHMLKRSAFFKSKVTSTKFSYQILNSRKQCKITNGKKGLWQKNKIQ